MGMLLGETEQGLCLNNGPEEDEIN
jgi:hypothetical protein